MSTLCEHCGTRLASGEHECFSCVRKQLENVRIKQALTDLATIEKVCEKYCDAVYYHPVDGLRLRHSPAGWEIYGPGRQPVACAPTLVEAFRKLREEIEG